MTRGSVLVVGWSARALARSALAAGHEVRTLDAFGDRDLLERVPAPVAHRTVWPFTPAAVAEAAATLPADAVAYGSSLENHPELVARLGEGRTILGNAPDVLRAVREPGRVTQALLDAGLPAPRVSDAAADDGARWMLKPRKGGGGRGVRPWTPGERVGEGEYLQERIDGAAGSLLFLADGRGMVPLALTRQLTGEGRLGGWGHCYSGSMLASRRHPLFERQDALFASACRAAEALVAAFGLAGLGTVDVIARDGTAWPLEVNPRPSASVELVERMTGASLFGAHAAAVAGRLPAAPHDPLGWDVVPGKAIVHARRGTTMRGGDGLLARGDIADISADGTPIPAGGPVCTVFAEAASGERCVEALVQRGRAVERWLRVSSEVA